MKKFILFISFLFIATICLNAQQSVQYSQYMLNQFRFNPGYAGMDESLSATGVYRDQWVGLEGRPRTQNFNIHLPFYYLGGGIGLNIENDLVGVEQDLKASLSYAYYLPIGKKSKLSIGVSGGVVQKTLNGELIRTPEGSYGQDPTTITHNDNQLPIGKERALAPNFSFGLLYKAQQFELGLSAENLAENKLNFQNVEGLNMSMKRSYFAYASYNFDIASNFNLRASMLAKSDVVQTQAEISSILTFKDNIFLGASFRGYDALSIDAIVMLAGVNLNEKIKLSYSYDLTLSGLKLVSDGSHEIMLNYNLNKDIGKGIPQKIIYNPRFL